MKSASLSGGKMEEALLKSVLARICSVIQATRAQFAATGEAFSPFAENLVYLGETGVSAILAMLLDPQRSHFQGARFLDALLGMIPESSIAFPVNPAILNVSTERFTWEDGSRRYIDIFVESPEFILAIENKTGAKVQQRQLADYLRWLESVSNGRKFFLVYLTPSGYSPADFSLPQGDKIVFQKHFACLSWLNLIETLEIAAQAAPAKVQNFINDFCSALKEKFSGKKQGVNMASEIVQALAEGTTAEELLAAGAIHNNYKKAAESIANAWSLRLLEYLEARGVPGEKRRYDLPNREKGETLLIRVRYDKKHLEAGVYANENDGDILRLGIWAQAWDTQFLASPWVRAAMRKFGVASLQNGSIMSASCADMTLENPHLLNRMRQQGSLFLGNELYELCQFIENLEPAD